jgi:Trypsin-co-occurring domain 2
MGRIELADVIASLRAEINRAWAIGQYDAVGFEAGPIEVELITEVEVVHAQGKIAARFWVLTVEGEAGRTSRDTQRITFALTPRDRRDPSRPLLIAGTAQQDEHRPGVPPVTPDQTGQMEQRSS